MLLLSLVNASLKRSASFVFHYPARPFLGLVGGTDSPPIKFHPPSGAAGILAYLGFFVLEGASPNTFTYPQTINWFAPFLRVTLWLLDSDYFEGGSEGIGELNCDFRASWPWGYVPVLLDFSSLVAGSSTSFNRSDLTAVSWASHPSPSCTKGLWSSWRDVFAIEINVVGIILPTFCFSCSTTKKRSMDGLTFFTTVFTL